MPISRIRRAVSGYFSEQASPFNLALFRIGFFFYILHIFDPREALAYSRFPAELRFPPLGLGPLLSAIPIDPDFAGKTAVLFLVSCSLALIGCFTRAACLAAAVCGIYLWGLPQFYGKVDHTYHHLIWFMIILGVSRCADVLSIDSIGKAFREADGNRGGEIRSSALYGLPLRWIWLLMGMIYFFPGFWKLASGWDWFCPDNLKYILYEQWFEMGGWFPSFRIDQHPRLCCLFACGTVLFELSFLFLVLFPRWRSAAAVGGLYFHAMLNWFMRIAFYELQVCYFSFVDWAGLSARIGKWLFKQPLYLLYDGDCRMCRRTVFSFRKFDLLGRVVYLNAREQGGQGFKDPSIPRADLERDMHAVIGQKKWLGFEAYRQWVLRIPIFWLLWPLLWAWPIPIVGRSLYRKIADSRSCRTGPPILQAPALEKGLSAASLLKGTGLFLLTINSVLGFGQVLEAWPFSCYPTFSAVRRAPETSILVPYGLAKNAEEKIDLNGLMKENMNNHKVASLMRAILAVSDKTRRDERLMALIRLLETKDEGLRRYSKIRFYKELHSTEPEKAGHSLVSRELVAEFSLGADRR